MRRQVQRATTDRLFAKINAQLVQPARDDAVRGDEQLRKEALDRDRGSQERDAALAARLDRLEGEIAGLARHLPFLLERLGEVNASAREGRRRLVSAEEGIEGSSRRLDDLALRLDEVATALGEVHGEVGRTSARTEFIRTEFLHELRHGGAQPGDLSDTETTIVNPEKLEGADLRINLGSGHVPLDGYVNCDARPLSGVDVVADVRSLPFEPLSAREIFSAHLLEHFPVEELRRRVLPHWVALLQPEGELRAVVPDAEKMIEEYAKGEFPFDDLRLVTYGEQEYTGDFHFNMFSRDSLRTLFEDVGLSSVEYTEVGRRNGRCYEMEIVGRKESTSAGSGGDAG